jgi:hypothetical protein
MDQAFINWPVPIPVYARFTPWDTAWANNCFKPAFARTG